MAEQEQIVIVCIRYKDAQASDITEGSVKDACAECANEIAVAPSTVAFAAKLQQEGKAATLLCIQCVQKRDDVLSDNRPPKVVPGQAQELSDFFGAESEEFRRVKEILQMPVRELWIEDKED